MPRIPVEVLAGDPVSEAGIASHLRFCPELEIVEHDNARVVVIAADHVEEDVLVRIRQARMTGDKTVVLVCGYLTEAGLSDVIEAGVSGLLRRTDVQPDRLTHAIRGVAEGRAHFPPDLLRRFLDSHAAAKRSGSYSRGFPLAGISPREKHVLNLLADGKSTCEIAKALAYSERTIKNAIHDLCARWQQPNRVAAVAFALRQGII